MTIRISMSLFWATLLASAIPCSANAAEFALCVDDFVGCQFDYTISCDPLQQDTIGAVQRKAAQICKERGYSSSAYRTVANGPGGHCGYYKWISDL
jgi:hypothetical protein